MVESTHLRSTLQQLYTLQQGKGMCSNVCCSGIYRCTSQSIPPDHPAITIIPVGSYSHKHWQDLSLVAELGSKGADRSQSNNEMRSSHLLCIQVAVLRRVKVCLISKVGG